MKVWVCIIETTINGEDHVAVEKVVASEAAADAWALDPPTVDPKTPGLERLRKLVTTPFEVEGQL